MVITHLYRSWNDPPSGRSHHAFGSSGNCHTSRNCCFWNQSLQLKWYSCMGELDHSRRASFSSHRVPPVYLFRLRSWAGKVPISKRGSVWLPLSVYDTKLVRAKDRKHFDTFTTNIYKLSINTYTYPMLHGSQHHHSEVTPERLSTRTRKSMQFSGMQRYFVRGVPGCNSWSFAGKKLRPKWWSELSWHRMPAACWCIQRHWWTCHAGWYNSRHNLGPVD